MVPGRIFRHEQFYLDRDTGLLRPKYFLVLAVPPSCDCAARADDTTRNQERAIRAELEKSRGRE